MFDYFHQMSDIFKRISKVIEKEGLNPTSFSKKIGVSDQVIRNIVTNERNKPGFDVLVAIIQTFDWLNSEWLITGKGEMLKLEDNQPNYTTKLNEAMDMIKQRDKIISLLEKENIRLEKRISELESKLNSDYKKGGESLTG